MSGPSPDKQPVHTVLSVMRGAEAWLQRRGVDAPQRSAELLLGKGIRTPWALATAVPARVVGEAELAQFDQSLRFLRNVNTPEDYRRALDELGP